MNKLGKEVLKMSDNEFTAYVADRMLKDACLRLDKFPQELNRATVEGLRFSTHLLTMVTKPLRRKQ